MSVRRKSTRPVSLNVLKAGKNPAAVASPSISQAISHNNPLLPESNRYYPYRNKPFLNIKQTLAIGLIFVFL